MMRKSPLQDAMDKLDVLCEVVESRIQPPGAKMNKTMVRNLIKLSRNVIEEFDKEKRQADENSDDDLDVVWHSPSDTGKSPVALHATESPGPVPKHV